ncbi:MAG: Rrf2 family transcriptional regulator [Ruminococcaceae bacterium]|nr:Rrf2 family transcriptional regulator [Oscillospiraceae bacterium]
MHINLESDYAVRIVHYMVHSGTRCDGRTVAEATGVSLRFALKIMGKLVAAGVVLSFKGAHGGYELARPAGEITLRQVIEAVEGPYRFSRCGSGEYTCTHTEAGVCPLYSVFDEVTRTVVEKLDTITFDRIGKV